MSAPFADLPFSTDDRYRAFMRQSSDGIWRLAAFALRGAAGNLSAGTSFASARRIEGREPLVGQ
jgi:hypothetical protein